MATVLDPAKNDIVGVMIEKWKRGRRSPKSLSELIADQRSWGAWDEPAEKPVNEAVKNGWIVKTGEKDVWNRELYQLSDEMKPVSD